MLIQCKSYISIKKLQWQPVCSLAGDLHSRTPRTIPNGTIRFYRIRVLNSKFANSSRNSTHTNQKRTHHQKCSAKATALPRDRPERMQAMRRRPDSPTECSKVMRPKKHTRQRANTCFARALLAVSNGNSQADWLFLSFFLHFLSFVLPN